MTRQSDREVADVDHLLNFAQRLGANLSDFDLHEVGQGVLVSPKFVTQMTHDLSASRCGHRAPMSENRSGATHGIIDIGRDRGVVDERHRTDGATDDGRANRDRRTGTGVRRRRGSIAGSDRVHCTLSDLAQGSWIEVRGGPGHGDILADGSRQSTVTPGTNKREAAEPPSMASAAMITAAAVYAVRSPLGNRSMVGYTKPVQ